MSMDLARKTFSCEPEYFIAGTNIRIATAVKETPIPPSFWRRARSLPWLRLRS